MESEIVSRTCRAKGLPARNQANESKQSSSPRRSLPLRPPVPELLLRGCDRERAYARSHRRYPDLWGPDQAPRALPFPGDRGQGRLPLGPYLEFIARVTSHIPDKGQVTVRYFGLYANAHRGKVRKASLGPFPLGIVGEELRPVPSRGWAALIRKPHLGRRNAEMIRKVYEVDPMVCPQCGSFAVLMFCMSAVRCASSLSSPTLPSSIELSST